MRRRQVIRILSGASLAALTSHPLASWLHAETGELLPLFPLNVVLLPGNTLPLRIFEPRYREMIQECIDKGIEFGVLRMAGAAISTVGCTAHVTDVIHRYRDGNFDILARGERRFRINPSQRSAEASAGIAPGVPGIQSLREEDFDSERSFYRGLPAYVDDEPGQGSRPDNDELIAQALNLRGRLNALIAEDDPQSALPQRNLPAASHPQLSFHLMDGLPADGDWKQELLELRVERERLVRVVLHLQRLIQYMEEDPENPGPRPVA